MFRIVSYCSSPAKSLVQWSSVIRCHNVHASAFPTIEANAARDEVL